MASSMAIDRKSRRRPSTSGRPDRSRVEIIAGASGRLSGMVRRGWVGCKERSPPHRIDGARLAVHHQDWRPTDPPEEQRPMRHLLFVCALALAGAIAATGA